MLRAGAGRIPACAGACQRPAASGRFRRRAPGGFVRSSPSDFSPPLHRSWCGLIGVAAAILAVSGWLDIANIQHSECACQVFMQLFLWLFFIWLLVKGMENVNFTIFGGYVVSLLASIGVLQTPGLYGFVFRRHLAVSPVTRNRRPSDALGWDALLFGLPNAFII